MGQDVKEKQTAAGPEDVEQLLYDEELSAIDTAAMIRGAAFLFAERNLVQVCCDLHASLQLSLDEIIPMSDSMCEHVINCKDICTNPHVYLCRDTSFLCMLKSSDPATRPPLFHRLHVTHGTLGFGSIDGLA